MNPVRRLPRPHRRLFAVAALLAPLLLPSMVRAQGATEAILNMALSSADLAVTATATAMYRIPGGAVRWIFIKNDCAKPLYFNFGNLDVYPIKLLQNQSFSGNFRVNSIGVSPDNTGTACTFTAVGGR